MVCMYYPGVHQLDILEAMTQGRGGHNVVCPGSKNSSDGSICIVSLLVPGLLVSKAAPGVEVLEHIFHIIGS